MTSLPPRWLDKLATKICAPHLREELLGDLHERYALRYKRSGARKARTFYFREVLALLRPSVMRRKPSSHGKVSLLSPEILSNYFKIGSRVLLKNRAYSLIHITGLAIGLWACMMVATVVIDSLSYDRQWSRADDIYRIINVSTANAGLTERSSSSAVALPPELKKNYPEVEAYSSISISEKHFKIHLNDPEGAQTHVLRADTAVRTILGVKLIAGNMETGSSAERGIVVSRSFAAKHFANQDPIGRTIYEIPRWADKAQPYVIRGLMEDLPYNSHFRADVIAPELYPKEAFSDTGFMSFGLNYILVKHGTDINAFTAKVNHWHTRFMKGNTTTRFEFQPLKDIYLHSPFADRQKVRSDAKTIYIFSGIAALLLFIACVNFINLSTARAFARLKEAGVRKILSGSRSQLIMQLLMETLLLFGISVCIAIGVYFLTIEPVEHFLGHKLVITFLSDPIFAAAALAIIFVTAILTGLYPAWLISGFKPSEALRGIFTTSLGQIGLRKGLVVAQFSISIVVLLATIVVWQQLDLMQNKELGYDKNNLISIDQVSWDGKGDAFKNELMRIPGVKRASIALWLPTYGAGYMVRRIADPSNAKNRIDVWYIAGDTDLPETMGLKLVEGRMFSNSYADALNADSLQKISFEKFEKAQMSQNALMTESAARILQVDKLDRQLNNVHVVPVGIIGDFYNESLYEPIKPTVILAQKSPANGGMLIRLEQGTEKQVIAGIQKLWKQFYPAKYLGIDRVDELIARQYEAESRLHQLFMFFSGLTMFLSALGIFGLVVQAAEQRAKEVGIRKVLGASVSGIVALLSKDFVKLVLISIAIASPLAWFSLEKWLDHYPYRTTVSWWIFIATGAATLALTIFTVSFQAIRAALADPVASLRNE